VTTLGDIVTEAQRRVLSSLREEINTLGTSVSANAVSLSLSGGQTLGSIQEGAILQVDYELFLVIGQPSTSAIPVLPGYYGSSSTSHASGAIITVNPRFPAVDLIKAINEDADALTSPANGLFAPAETTLTFNPVISGYDFTDSSTGLPVDPSTVIDLIEVRVHEYGPAQIWPVVPLSLVRFQRQADTTIFPSGMALEFKGLGFAGRPIRVQYKSTYNTPLVNSSDDVQAVLGMHPQAHDILTLGAVLRLMEFRELKRSFTETQAEPRRAQEVPVGSSLTAMKGIMQRRADRIAEERMRLERQYQPRWY
jgi:hypothetical protein